MTEMNMEVAAVPPRKIEAAPDDGLKTLGEEIVWQIAMGDNAGDEFYKSAGLQLIKAKKCVKNFKAFLRDHCNNLSRSRAYELIDIADGKKTVKQTRVETSERKKRSLKNKVAAKSTAKPAPVPQATVSVTERTPKASAVKKAWDELKWALDHYSPLLDTETKQTALAYATEKLGRV